MSRLRHLDTASGGSGTEVSHNPSVSFAGDEALETSDDVPLGEPFGAPSDDVFNRRLVMTSGRSQSDTTLH